MRIVIAEDQVLMRAGLARLLTDAGHYVVGEAGDATAALVEIARHEPDLVIMDVRMPPTHTDEGLRAARDVRAKYPRMGVLVLSQHIETRGAVELVRTGRFGYLLKDRVLQVGEFLEAAERVAAGGSALDPEVVSTLLQYNPDGGPLVELTHREREVLHGMAEGRTNAAIGRRLHLTPKTVEGHVSQIFVKLGLPPGPDDHRRVLAVLTFLDAS